MSEKILNVYEFQLDDNKNSYIYSLEKKENALQFKYYILTKNDNLEPIICEAGNILDILQTNNIKLTPVKRDNVKYQKFLIELEEGIKNSKNKEKVTVKK